MAQKRIVELVDDLDGEPAGETVRFAIDGCAYDIDLSPANAQRLRSVLQTYASAGRRTGLRRPNPDLNGHEGAAGSQDSGQIREWARARGLEVSARGRIPAYLRQAYERR